MRNDNLINELDRKFANYQMYDREIAERKVELATPVQDDNIGGSRSGKISKPTELKVIMEMSDPYIANRELWKKGIKETIDNQSDEIKNLIELKYFGEDSWMDWRSFGEKHGYSNATIYRIRKKVLLKFGKIIGEV